MAARTVAFIALLPLAVTAFALTEQSTSGSTIVSPVEAAATCSDYANQREAQLRADTRDADGDGIYCESLPCPCLRPGTGGGAPDGRCKGGRLPDYRCTPGRALSGVTARDVCTPGYARRVRSVSSALKRKVYLSYGIRQHRPYAYEIDHLVSLELGGSNSEKNLWPERQPGAKGKDRIENLLHHEVCAGSLSLKAAQREIRHWLRVRSTRSGLAGG